MISIRSSIVLLYACYLLLMCCNAYNLIRPCFDLVILSLTGIHTYTYDAIWHNTSPKSEQTVCNDLHRVKTREYLFPKIFNSITRFNILHHGWDTNSHIPITTTTSRTQQHDTTEPTLYSSMDKLPPSPIKLTPPAPKADYSQRTITHVPLLNLTVPSVRESLRRSSINNRVATTG